MKKWECTICGYIHEGETPPDECPLCGASADKFVLVQEHSSQKRWECTICGYIHEGNEPPPECPVCKAGPDKFRELQEGESTGADSASPQVSPAPTKSSGDQKPSLFTRLVLRLHLHPISVHFPNGVLPVAVVFLALAIFLGIGVLGTAAWYNMIFVLLTMPLVLVTGYLEWQNRYKGAKTFIFLVKIACSVTVAVTLTILVAWRFIDPEVASADSGFRLIYLGIGLVMLAATGIAGHLGGKLVFGTRDSR